MFIKKFKLKGGISMRSTVYDWMKDGFTSVPNILFDQFHQLELTGDEMILLLYILAQINQGKSVEDMNQTSIDLGWASGKVMECLSTLMNKDYLQIELVPNKEGKQSDHYTLRPLFDKLDEISYQQTSQPTKPIAPPSEGFNIVTSFEQEFGRQLTQIELETLNDWINISRYDEKLVQLALKQAVLNQALSLKYIDRILLNWEKKNIRTVAEADRDIERFENRHAKKDAQSNTDTSQYEHLQIPINYWDIGGK